MRAMSHTGYLADGFYRQSRSFFRTAPLQQMRAIEFKTHLEFVNVALRRAANCGHVKLVFCVDKMI
jgi:hypothetical protein